MSNDKITTEITNLNEFLDEKKLFFQENYCKQVLYDVKPEQFEFLVLLGVGSFGKVYLVKRTDTDEYCAMKCLIKRYIVKKNQVEHTLDEKRILECLKFPFTINLLYFCMNDNYIYFILPFIPGGEVFNLLKLHHIFPEPVAKFYAAQILLGLEYLHHLDLVYRDLKLENLLIDRDGYIKLADFGFCKILKGRTWTLCGTPDYIAPEIILNKGYGKSVDYWSYGVLIYEMCAGCTPFVAPDIMSLYEKIVSGKYPVVARFTRELKDFVKRILQKDPTKRYGNLKDGVTDIKKHAWFQNMNWLDLINRKIQPPFIPTLSGPNDTKYFDSYPDEVMHFESADESLQEKFIEF